MRLMVALVFLTLSSMGALAQGSRVDRIDVNEFGIYSVHVEKNVAAAGTATGTTLLVSNIRLVSAVRTIPARRGVQFGFRYTVIGAPQGAPVTLKKIVIYPGPGLLNPANQRPMTHDEQELTKMIGQQATAGYSFDNDWEVVPGVWTMQLWYQGSMLAEEKFTVVKQ